MTATDSVDGVLGDIAAATATAAWNFANFVLDGCELNHAEADLRWFGFFGDGAGPLYASNSGPVSNGRLTNAGVANTQSRRLHKENANQVKEGDCQTDRPTNKRAKVAKWTVSEAAAARVTEKKLKRVWRRARRLSPRRGRAHPTQPQRVRWWVVVAPTPSSGLASLISFTFILDHLKSNTNFELNYNKNLFRKFYNPQLISFLENALSAQPQSYKSLDSLIFSALRFLGI